MSSRQFHFLLPFPLVQIRGLPCKVYQFLSNIITYKIISPEDTIQLFGHPHSNHPSPASTIGLNSLIQLIGNSAWATSTGSSIKNVKGDLVGDGIFFFLRDIYPRQLFCFLASKAAPSLSISWASVSIPNFERARACR